MFLYSFIFAIHFRLDLTRLDSISVRCLCYIVEVEEAELYYFLYHNTSSNSDVGTICTVFSLFFSLFLPIFVCLSLLFPVIYMYMMYVYVCVCCEYYYYYYYDVFPSFSSSGTESKRERYCICDVTFHIIYVGVSRTPLDIIWNL